MMSPRKTLPFKSSWAVGRPGSLMVTVQIIQFIKNREIFDAQLYLNIEIRGHQLNINLQPFWGPPFCQWLIAQMVERVTADAKVRGSNPAKVHN